MNSNQVSFSMKIDSSTTVCVCVCMFVCMCMCTSVCMNVYVCVNVSNWCFEETPHWRLDWQASDRKTFLVGAMMCWQQHSLSVSLFCHFVIFLSPLLPETFALESKSRLILMFKIMIHKNCIYCFELNKYHRNY